MIESSAASCGWCAANNTHPESIDELWETVSLEQLGLISTNESENYTNENLRSVTLDELVRKHHV